MVKYGRKINEVNLLTRAEGMVTAKQSVGGKVKENFKSYLDSFAPGDISTKGVDDINDAYRHYMAAAELTRLIGPDLTFFFGDMNEVVNNGYSPQSTIMDYWNNDAGIKSGRDSDSGFESALKFTSDVVGGKVKIIDKRTLEPRFTNYHDMPHAHDGSALEDRYIPDNQTGAGDGETLYA